MRRLVRRRPAAAVVQCAPIRPTAPRHLISASCALSSAPAPHLGTSTTSEPYGQEYGAGPSRLPYRGPIEAEATQLAHTRRHAILRARTLRQHLSTIESAGQYATSDAFASHLRNVLPGFEPSGMTRVELHSLLHQLLYSGQSTLALSILSHLIAVAPTHGHRMSISTRTLRALLQAELTRQSFLKTEHISRGRAGSKRYAIMLDLLRSLQSVRHHRPIELYILLVHMSVADKRPDKAAEIFVGLVEEWVTEGRIAEGADVEGFYEGGGPPRVLSWDRSAEKNKSWWTGVRTWTLPGEVLSPHDRLDLWHPAKLSLGKKFKNFPFPVATSPPSVVPAPSARLLDPILAALRLDPTVAASEDFEASMRACAILANTVLSRTLPLASLGPLLHALQATPSNPPVYPASLDPIPENDAWAYEAFTQVHLALQSFFFSPPISAASFALARANSTIVSGAPATTYAHRYRLQPLSMQDVMILVRYALEKMRMVDLLERLARYMKRTFSFGWTRPVFWNALLRGATATGDKGVAALADDALFRGTQLARPMTPTFTPALTDGKQASTFASLSRMPVRPHKDRRESSTSNTTLLSVLQPPPGMAIQADEESLLTLIHYLGKTSQFDRLVDLTYRLIPFLQDSRRGEEGDKSMQMGGRRDSGSKRRTWAQRQESSLPTEWPPASPQDIAAVSHEAASDEKLHGTEEVDGNPEYGLSGRRVPQHLSPALYSALLTSISLAGRTGLAQRVFTLACSAEKGWTRDYFESYPDVTPAEIPASCRLPLPIFTAMLRVWNGEIQGRVEADRSNAYPLGWVPPPSRAGQPRHISASLMARSVYLQAASRFAYPGMRQAARRGRAGRNRPSPDTTPDAQFFDMALSALSSTLRFRRAYPDLGPAETDLLDRLVRDMTTFGIAVPPALKKRHELAMRGEEGWGTDLGALRPAQYRVHWPSRDRIDKEERSAKLRGLAEGLMRADEEGMWRDKETREREEGEEREWREGRWKVDSGLRSAGELA